MSRATTNAQWPESIGAEDMVRTMPPGSVSTTTLVALSARAEQALSVAESADATTRNRTELSNACLRVGGQP
jgi:hypothetical protein